MVVEWKQAVQVATTHEATAIATLSIKLAQYKGNRKIVESEEVEKSYKFKEYPFIKRLYLEIVSKSK